MKTEPVALIAAIAVILVTVAAAFGIVLDTGVIETLLINGLFIVAAVAQRARVTPTA